MEFGTFAVLRGRDPSLNVVILEDTAAVAGVGIAAACMALTMYTGSPIPDALGSLAIGGLLGTLRACHNICDILFLLCWLDLLTLYMVHTLW